MKAAVGQRAAQAFVEKQEQKCHLDTLCRELIRVAAAVAFEQAVAFQFAQVVAELVELVALREELEGGEDCLMDLFGRSAADGTAVMQENLQQPDDPGVMEFDAGITD